VYGASGDTPTTNANGTVIDDIRAQSCGAGVHVAGQDANACTISNVQCYNTGDNYSGTGGFGFYDNGTGNCWVMPHAEIGTGRGIWNPSPLAMSTFTAPYIEGTLPCYATGLILGGEGGSAFELGSPHTGFGWERQWINLFSAHVNVSKIPQMRLSDHSAGTFFERFSQDSTGANTVGERYYSAGVAPDGKVVGCWVTGADGVFAGVTGDRRIDGYTTPGEPGIGSWGQSPQGTANKWTFRGQFFGDDNAPRYVGYAKSSISGANDIGSKKDRFVRYEHGLGGRRGVGDRFETGAEDSIGDYVYREGWESFAVWNTPLNATCYDAHHGGNPTITVEPTTPNGFVYACTTPGAVGGSEPTWSSAETPLANDGRVAYRWHANMVRRVGDYGAPSVSAGRNGHYYKVTSVSGADVDGYALGGSSEPSWPTGGGSTVADGALTWTEMGSDVGSYIADGTTEWQCIGPTPLYRNYGFRTWVPYQVEFDDVVVGAYDADGVTLYKVVTVNSGQPTIGDLTTNLQIKGALVNIKTGGELDIVDTHTVFAAGFGGRPDVLTTRIAPVATTDATVTDLYTWTLAEGTNTLTAEIQVRKSDYSHSASFGRKCTFRRNGSSAVFQGTVIDTGSEEADLASLTITIDNSGTTGRLRFTGIVATNLVVNATVNLVNGD
jgi:hypothetical protein